MVEFSNINEQQLYAAIEVYPWFCAARAALCVRTCENNGPDAARSLFKEFLPYLPEPSFVARCLRGKDIRYNDDSLAEALRNMIRNRPRVMVAGMDFFSRDQYDSVRSEDDNFGRMAVTPEGESSFVAPAPAAEAPEADTMDLVTETLAELYVNQGYPEQAIDIYSKLSLLNPEKSVYFASLIEKLKEQ